MLKPVLARWPARVPPAGELMRGFQDLGKVLGVDRPSPAWIHQQTLLVHKLVCKLRRMRRKSSNSKSSVLAELKAFVLPARDAKEEQEATEEHLQAGGEEATEQPTSSGQASPRDWAFPSELEAYAEDNESTSSSELEEEGVPHTASGCGAASSTLPPALRVEPPSLEGPAACEGPPAATAVGCSATASTLPPALHVQPPSLEGPVACKGPPAVACKAPQAAKASGCGAAASPLPPSLHVQPPGLEGPSRCKWPPAATAAPKACAEIEVHWPDGPALWLIACDPSTTVADVHAVLATDSRLQGMTFVLSLAGRRNVQLQSRVLSFGVAAQWHVYGVPAIVSVVVDSDSESLPSPQPDQQDCCAAGPVLSSAAGPDVWPMQMPEAVQAAVPPCAGSVACVDGPALPGSGRMVTQAPGPCGLAAGDPVACSDGLALPDSGRVLGDAGPAPCVGGPAPCLGRVGPAAAPGNAWQSMPGPAMPVRLGPSVVLPVRALVLFRREAPYCDTHVLQYHASALHACLQDLVGPTGADEEPVKPNEQCRLGARQCKKKAGKAKSKRRKRARPVVRGPVSSHTEFDAELAAARQQAISKAAYEQTYTAPAHTHTHTHTDIPAHTCTCTCTHAHMHMHMHMHAQAHTHTHTCTALTHLHTHTHTHAHTHTHTCTRARAHTHALITPLN